MSNTHPSDAIAHLVGQCADMSEQIAIARHYGEPTEELRKLVVDWRVSIQSIAHGMFDDMEKAEAELAAARARIAEFKMAYVRMKDAEEQDLHCKLGVMRDCLEWLVETEDESRQAAIAHSVAYWITAFNDAHSENNALTARIAELEAEARRIAAGIRAPENNNHTVWIGPAETACDALDRIGGITPEEHEAREAKESEEAHS